MSIHQQWIEERGWAFELQGSANRKVGSAC